MKKKIALLLAVLMLVLSGATPVRAELAYTNIYLAIGDDVAFINGAAEELDIAPYVKNKTTLVPLRLIAENLGVTVNWASKTKTITMVKDKTTVILTLGKKTATVDGKSKTLPVAPESRYGVTMVPLRFITESLGASLVYYADVQGISIANDPNFHFVMAETENYTALVPYDWTVEEDSEFLSVYNSVYGEDAGILFNSTLVDAVPTAAEMKTGVQDFIKSINGTVVAGSEISEEGYYYAAVEYKDTGSGGEYTGYVYFYYDNDSLYFVFVSAVKGIENTNPMILEKLYVTESSLY